MAAICTAEPGRVTPSQVSETSSTMVTCTQAISPKAMQ
jgi:hypothetical protein